ncbi:hypothetical protein OV079_51565 [Nannocystis pusilla]|uniref:Uncharacterized protein n=1 Tax=Nannocystis pusilla TaxID=889268 RepID=A0A9X3F1W3_9BACT|nr:hypothetical protein [Nannocystis pusilla]MCY1013830.1 hypothetical protein [Nannocystis pusilla]
MEGARQRVLAEEDLRLIGGGAAENEQTEAAGDAGHAGEILQGAQGSPWLPGRLPISSGERRVLVALGRVTRLAGRSCDSRRCRRVEGDHRRLAAAPSSPGRLLEALVTGSDDDEVEVLAGKVLQDEPTVGPENGRTLPLQAAASAGDDARAGDGARSPALRS